MGDASTTSAAETLQPGSAVARTVATIGAALLVDAAVETMRAGAGVRWWVAGAAAAYVALTALTWRAGIRWTGRLALALAGLFGVIAATAWRPGGLIDGIRVAGQTTPVVVSVVIASGIAIACAAMWREQRIPRGLRIAVGVLAVYGASAFLLAASRATPLGALFAGAGLWSRLPPILQGAFVGGLVVLPLGLVVASVRVGLRRPPGGSVRADLWRVTAIGTSLAMVLAAVPIGPRALVAAVGGSSAGSIFGGPAAPPAADVRTALANSFRAIEDGERESSRERWDPAYVASRLGSDPTRLLTWVRNNTFWIPYRGLLRGPVGVLMDRRGSSLDRAVLLAVLLRQSGRPAAEVRIARGALTRDQAARRLAPLEIAHFRSQPRAAFPDDRTLATVASQYQLDEASVRRTLDTQAEADARRRTQVLSRVPGQAARLAAAFDHPAPNRRAIFDRAVSVLQEHWWVQILDHGAWRDLDLLAGPDGAPLARAAETFDLDGLPIEQSHQMVVRVVAEQWAAGVLTERVALERLLRPADVIGQPVMLRFSASKWPADFPTTGVDLKQALRSTALQQHEWVPILSIGRDQTVQSAITDAGVVKKPSREEEMAQYGRDTRDRAKAAADLFNPFGPAPAAPAPATPAPATLLTAAWIEYDIRVPGEPAQKIRRAVFDLLGPAERARRPAAAPRIDDAAALGRSLAMMMETEILPVVSRIAPQFVTHLAAQALLANRETINAVARGELPNDFAHAQDLAKRLVPMPSPLYSLARVRFDWNRFPDALFIDRPNVFTRHLFFAPTANGVTLQLATDIVANDVGVDLLARDPTAIRLEQGVLDTNAEAILLSDRPHAQNAGWAFENSAEWITIRSAADPKLASLSLPDDVKRRIVEDVAAGNVVVAPKAPVEVGTDRFSGWWRVDPVSGRALGMGANGWGQSLPEWALIIATGAATGFFFSYLWCLIAGSPDPAMANACEPSRHEPRFSAVRFFFPSVEASNSGCLGAAVIGALLGGLFAALGAAFGAGAGRGVGGSREGGVGVGPGPGEPPPEFGPPPDTVPSDPPSFDPPPSRGGGNPPPRGGGNAPPSGGDPPRAGGNPPSGGNQEPPNDWEWENERRYWEAWEKGDQERIEEAIRDSIRFETDRPNWEKWLIDPPRDMPPMGFGPPKPYTPPPPPPPPAPQPSPFAKSVDGLAGAADGLGKIK